MYPNSVDNKEPERTPILTPSKYTKFSAKAKFPMNRLIVNPIPVKMETPYKLIQLELFGIWASFNFIDTYENKTRLNGDWDLLLENCAFLDKQREKYPYFKIFYDFVVQVDNYKEMKPFIQLIQERFPNRQNITFSMIVDWGTFSPHLLNHKCIWKETHPEHQQFLEILRDPIFNSENIRMGNLSSLQYKAKRAL